MFSSAPEQTALAAVLVACNDAAIRNPLAREGIDEDQTRVSEMVDVLK